MGKRKTKRSKATIHKQMPKKAPPEQGSRYLEERSKWSHSFSQSTQKTESSPSGKPGGAPNCPLPATSRPHFLSCLMLAPAEHPQSLAPPGCTSFIPQGCEGKSPYLTERKKSRSVFSRQSCVSQLS